MQGRSALAWCSLRSFAMSFSSALSVRTFSRIPLGVLAVAALFVATSASAQDIPAQINLHLMAGEFGPAKALAAGMADPAARNAMFRNIAMAQARLGNRGAALNTAMGMNGLGRGQAFGAIGGMPAGAMGGASMADFDTL